MIIHLPFIFPHNSLLKSPLKLTSFYPLLWPSSQQLFSSAHKTINSHTTATHTHNSDTHTHKYWKT